MSDSQDKVKVLLFVESRYKVNRKRIKATLNSFLRKQGLVGSAEVSIAIVGDRKMRMLNHKHRGIDKTTNVLSFSLVEGESTHIPDKTLRLGDIIISYPQVIKEAAAEEKMVDDKVDELLMHSALHLLGVHH